MTPFFCNPIPFFFFLLTFEFHFGELNLFIFAYGYMHALVSYIVSLYRVTNFDRLSNVFMGIGLVAPKGVSTSYACPLRMLPCSNTEMHQGLSMWQH